MANKKSAQKYLGVTARRTEENNLYRKSYKKLTKQVVSLSQSGKTKEAQEKFSLAQKALDKAAKVGVIKKGAADRKKSRLSAKVNVTPAKK